MAKITDIQPGKFFEITENAKFVGRTFLKLEEPINGFCAIYLDGDRAGQLSFKSEATTQYEVEECPKKITFTNYRRINELQKGEIFKKDGITYIKTTKMQTNGFTAVNIYDGSLAEIEIENISVEILEISY